MNSTFFRGDTARLGLGAANEDGGIRLVTTVVPFEAIKLGLVCDVSPRLFLSDVVISMDSTSLGASSETRRKPSASSVFTSDFNVRSSSFLGRLFALAFESSDWQESGLCTAEGSSVSSLILGWLAGSFFVSETALSGLGDMNIRFPWTLLLNFGAIRGIQDLHLAWFMAGWPGPLRLRMFTSGFKSFEAVLGRVLEWGTFLGHRVSLA